MDEFGRPVARPDDNCREEQPVANTATPEGNPEMLTGRAECSACSLLRQAPAERNPRSGKTRSGDYFFFLVFLAPDLAFGDFLAVFLAISRDSCHVGFRCQIQANRSCALRHLKREATVQKHQLFIDRLCTLEKQHLRHASQPAYIEICRARQPQRLAFESFGDRTPVITELQAALTKDVTLSSLRVVQSGSFFHPGLFACRAIECSGIAVRDCAR